ncbi:hypothetical protein GY45DRAFT_1325645, partial [Cubamyces sp. BRFM 1775]
MITRLSQPSSSTRYRSNRPYQDDSMETMRRTQGVCAWRGRDALQGTSLPRRALALGGVACDCPRAEGIVNASSFSACALTVFFGTLGLPGGGCALCRLLAGRHLAERQRRSVPWTTLNSSNRTTATASRHDTYGPGRRDAECDHDRRAD